MQSKSLEAAEAECAAGRTAPRVSFDDIKNAIDGAFYMRGSAILPDAVQTGSVEDRSYGPLDNLTICLVVMKNGFTVIGKSAPASPDNFDETLGMTLAYEDAVRQIWPLMGFALRDWLHNNA